jgi:hypothetical protein
MGFHDHFLFFGNVASHLVALMSGIASFVLSTITAIRKRPIIERWFWVAGAICLIAAFDGAWQDEHRNTQTVIAEKSAQAGLANICAQNLRVAQAYSLGVEGINKSLQGTLDSQQNQLNSQQGTMNSCVLSLGKMNPILNAKFGVIAVPVNWAKQRHALGSEDTVYFFAIVIMTNNKADPVGLVQCANAFKIISAPELNMQAGSGMVASQEPKAINDRTYEIRVSNTGAEWTGENPIYMAASSSSQYIGQCTFKPQ